MYMYNKLLPPPLLAASILACAVTVVFYLSWVYLSWFFFILACTPVQFILTRLKENHSDKAQGELGTDECLG